MDANDHSPKIVAGEWGSREMNAKGRILLEALSHLNLVIANTECVNTSRKRKIESMIDVTFVGDVLAKDLQWCVSEEYTLSDRQAIIFEIMHGTRMKWSRARAERWAANGFDE